MTIKVNIEIKGVNYYFSNAETGKLIGTIREGKNKPGIYVWESFDEGGFTSLAKCVNYLKLELMTRAEQLGCDIKFIYI